MQDQEQLTPSERELENALRSLRPRDARLDPVAAAREAIRRVARGRVVGWRAAAAAVAVATGLGAWKALGPEPAALNGSPRSAAAMVSRDHHEPTLLAYRRALNRSPAEFEALLDKQALSHFSQRHVPMFRVVLVDSDLKTLEGEL